MKDILGSGCGKVGSAVASKTREPGFESSHWEFSLNNYLLLTVCRKDENKSKRGRGSRLFFKKSEGYFAPYTSTYVPPLPCVDFHSHFRSPEGVNFLPKVN